MFVSGRKSLPVGRVPDLLHPRPSEALMCICYRRIDQNLSVWTDVMPQAAKVSGSYWPVLRSQRTLKKVPDLMCPYFIRIVGYFFLHSSTDSYL